MISKEKIIAVIGATGSQGGAVAKALLNSGNNVRILVRQSSVDTLAAQKLKEAGAEIAIADLDDPASFQVALKDAYGLFSVQAMDNGTDSERRHADILVEAAIKANIQHIVHVSVSQLGNFENFPGWGENRWNESYWLDKQYAEDKIKNAGLKYWTVLRPTLLMENFLNPKVNFMYPDLKDGKLTVVFKENTKLQFIDVGNIGEFAVASFNNAEKFNHKILELASDELTINEIAKKIETITGKHISVAHISMEKAIDNGVVWPYANYQEWTNVVGYNVNITALKSLGIPLTSLDDFLRKNRKNLPL